MCGRRTVLSVLSDCAFCVGIRIDKIFIGNGEPGTFGIPPKEVFYMNFSDKNNKNGKGKLTAGTGERKRKIISPRVSAAMSHRMVVRITLTAMFTALALVAKSFTKLPVAAFGVDGLQISLGGIFTFFPAVLFGPLYGGLSSALTDFLGAMLMPTGAYIPWLTVTAFAGGCIKGLIWKLITGKRSIKLRIIALAVFIVVGSLGISFGTSLSRDGIVTDGIFMTKKVDLPTRGELDGLDGNGKYKLSPMSQLAVGLARYNKDKFTLTEISFSDISVDGVLVLPSAITVDGLKTSITKLGKGAIKGEEGTVNGGGKLKELVIPPTYTATKGSIPTGVLTALSKDVTIVAVGQESWNDNRASVPGWLIELRDKGYITDEVGENDERIRSAPVLEVSSRIDGNETRSEFTKGGFVIQSSDTYRKYLSGYVNFVCGGLAFSAMLGIIFIALNFVIEYLERRRKLRADEYYNGVSIHGSTEYEVDMEFGSRKKRISDNLRINAPDFFRILTAVTLAGLFVTTVNTVILRIYLPAWNGRLFAVLLIPRVCEEIIVQVIQAYIISLVWGAVNRGKLGRLLDRL